MRRLIGAAARRTWGRVAKWGAIGPRDARRTFRSFGDGSGICFPVVALFGERYISIGAHTIIGPNATLSAGVSPEHDLGVDEVVTIGDRCLIGKGSGIVAHERVVIGDDVFTGHNVYITDANHGYEDVTIPIGQQFAAPRPVSIGAGSWLGHGTVVLPGAHVGRHVVIGAGSVVTGAIPDYSVAVGNPARVIRRYADGVWADVPPNQGMADQGMADQGMADQGEAAGEG